MTRRRGKSSEYDGMSIGDILNQTANNIDSGSRTGFDLIKFTAIAGPQQQFIESEAFEVLYGGAAGGGKSAGLVAFAAERMHMPGHHAVLLRRTNGQLAGSGGLIDKSREFYREAGWLWRAGMMRWIDPASGGTVDFRHLNRPKDLENYIGLEFTDIGIDELTQFAENEYLLVISRLRSPNPNIRPRVRNTTNPGGVGHEWVRNRWRAWLDPKYASHYIDEYGEEWHFGPAQPGEIRWFKRIEDVDTEVPPGTRGALSRTYIPAKVTDNPYLMQNEEYVNKLTNLPELQRKQMLEGDWGVYQEGGIFKHEYFHKVEMHEIPTRLKWYRGFDLAGTAHSQSDRSAWAEVAVDSKNNIYIRRCWAGRIPYPEQKRRFKSVMLNPAYGGAEVENGIEYASNGIPIFDDFMEDADLNHISFKPIHAGTTDKISRAQPLANKGANGKVYIVDDETADATIEEFVLLGNKGAADDRVDAVVIAYLMSTQGAAVVRRYA